MMSIVACIGLNFTADPLRLAETASRAGRPGTASPGLLAGVIRRQSALRPSGDRSARSSTVAAACRAVSATTSPGPARLACATGMASSTPGARAIAAACAGPAGTGVSTRTSAPTLNAA